MKTKLTVLMLFVGMMTYAQTADMIEMVRKGNEQIKTFSSKFTELQYRKVSKQSQDMAGKMYFDAIGRLSMLYTDPEGDYIIIDGTTFVTRRNGKKTHFSVEKKSVMTDLKSSLLHSMRGEVQEVADENDADITSKADKQYYTFTLVRRNIDKKQKREVAKMVLRYDKRTFVLVYMNIEDVAGNLTTYALQNPQVNAKVPDDVFLPKK